MTILRIGNTPRDYAWGSTHLIPDLMGLEATATPQAEVWFGTHPSSPSAVLDAEGGTLAERVGELGFLVKLLAAERPLSIQAHPTKEHAAKRFAEGYPGYTDANHKPELIAAISQFKALCGFRPLANILDDVTRLATENNHFEPWLSHIAASGLAGAMEWALQQDANLSVEMVAAADSLEAGRAAVTRAIFDSAGPDVGVLVSLLMNYVELSPGQALFLPAGNIHAYLSGLGVEVMAASDNVLRGGLTKKLIDAPELMRVLEFSELHDPMAKQRELVRGLVQYEVGVPDFRFYRLEPSGSNLLVDLKLSGKAILVCTAGQIAITTSLDEMIELRTGETCYFEAANYFSILGSGTGYLAMG